MHTSQPITTAQITLKLNIIQPDANKDQKASGHHMEPCVTKPGERDTEQGKPKAAHRAKQAAGTGPGKQEEKERGRGGEGEGKEGERKRTLYIYL